MSVVVRDSYRDWVEDHHFYGLSVTLTAKQVVDGVRLDPIILQRNIRYFKNILNRQVFGNSHQRYGRELKTLFILEYDEDVRYHSHCIIEHPERIELEEFKDLIRDVWSNKTLFGYDQIQIKDPSNQERKEGWLKYIMKSKTKPDFSLSIDLENSSCFNLC